MPSRTLVAIVVYGGTDFVPACLDSAARLSGIGETVDVLVLDDCSPDEAWSHEVRSRCSELGLGYYRSPRNLGIPRNMNLGLLRAARDGYDHVVIANSDVVFPANLVPALVATAGQDPAIASVTAWSNHVSSFSLENSDPERNLASSSGIDRVSALLESHFRGRPVDVPVGVGFCMLVPVPMVKRVGLFDPIFGRGYCEEVDWCLRARSFGLRNVLAPSVFVYHAGNATSKSIGMLEAWQTSVPANEAVIDLRYPEYRDQLVLHDESGALERLRDEAARALVVAGAREHGYVVEVSWLDHADAAAARFVIAPRGDRAPLRGRHGGFEAVFSPVGDPLATLETLTGSVPTTIVVRDRGGRVDEVIDAAARRGIVVVDEYDYPTPVGPAGVS